MTIGISNLNSPGPTTVWGTKDCGVIAGNGSADVALSWPVPLPDANYVVVTDLVEVGGPTANVTLKRQVLTKTATGITVRVTAGSVGYSSGGLLLHAIGIHD